MRWYFTDHSVSKFITGSTAIRNKHESHNTKVLEENKTLQFSIHTKCILKMHGSITCLYSCWWQCDMAAAERTEKSAEVSCTMCGPPSVPSQTPARCRHQAYGESYTPRRGKYVCQYSNHTIEILLLIWLHGMIKT